MYIEVWCRLQLEKIKICINVLGVSAQLILNNPGNCKLENIDIVVRLLFIGNSFELFGRIIYFVLRVIQRIGINRDAFSLRITILTKSNALSRQGTTVKNSRTANSAVDSLLQPVNLPTN